MFCVYILKLKNEKYYIGSTINLKRRLLAHSQGKSEYTSKYLPLKLMFYKKYDSMEIAKKIESKLKKMKNKKILDKIIKNKNLTIKLS